MNITTQKAKLAALLTELENLIETKGDAYQQVYLLNEITHERYQVALNVSPELRAWVDKIISTHAKNHTK